MVATCNRKQNMHIYQRIQSIYCIHLLVLEYIIKCRQLTPSNEIEYINRRTVTSSFAAVAVIAVWKIAVNKQ